MYGSRIAVFTGKARMTVGRLTADDLSYGCRGEIVSKKAQELARKKWNSTPIRSGPHAGKLIRDIFNAHRAPPYGGGKVRDMEALEMESSEKGKLDQASDFDYDVWTTF